MWVTKMRAPTIGKVAEKTKINVETIRYYEKIGLVLKPDRTPGGNRIYDEAAISRLNFIKRSRGLGFSIEEIRELLSMVDGTDFSCADIHRITTTHVGRIQAKIANLQKIEGVLQGMAAKCDRGQVPECPIIDVLMDVR